MRLTTVLVVLVCAAVPAAAQSARVYTNADLTSTVVTWTRSVTPEEWQGLAARQFVPGPDYPIAPTAFVIPYSPSRDLLPAPTRSFSSYADDLWRDPVRAYHLQHPIEAAYGFHHGGAIRSPAYGSSVRPIESHGRPSSTIAALPAVRKREK